MNFTEAAAKPLLAGAGIAVPDGEVADSPEAAEAAARRLGPCVVKAQVPTGKRGKAGGIRRAATPAEARAHAEAIIGMTIGDHPVERVLVEAQLPIARELYAAVLSDPASKGPLVMFSATGGMDIEAIAERDPRALRRRAVDVRRGLDAGEAAALADGLDDAALREAVADALVCLYGAYREADAELLEVNPLAALADGRVVALDCKLTLDDSALGRQPELAARGSPERLDALEARAAALGLRYISLDGDIGVLANGAGVTMTTMDVIAHLGGRPANFLEIGGEAYTKATPALEIVLDNPNVRSMVVNFCGAFARTDVMTAGVIDAMQALAPAVPFAFSIHGTGSDAARRMLEERLGIACHPTMDDAIRAAIDAARG